MDRQLRRVQSTCSVPHKIKYDFIPYSGQAKSGKSLWNDFKNMKTMFEASVKRTSIKLQLIKQSTQGTLLSEGHPTSVQLYVITTTT